MNIYDIAKIAGVSIATVSRVVNGSDKVSEKTRARVLDIIAREGYTPNVFAQGLGLNTMHTVGVLVPDIADLYMSGAVSFLEEQLHRSGYECILSCSGFDLERKRSHVQMLLSKKIDALILVGSTYAGSGISNTQTDYIREAASEVPVFMINGVVSGENIYCSACDDRNATKEAVGSLIAAGRKKILFLTDSGSYSAQQKMKGYQDALADAGLPLEENLMLRIHKNRIHTVRDELNDLSVSNALPSFDAVLATDDTLAVGAMKYALGKGLRIPEDLAVIGYNNSAFSISSEPELTSIDSRLEDLCKNTADTLIRLLSSGKDSEEGDLPAPEPLTLFPCRIVWRQSAVCSVDI